MNRPMNNVPSAGAVPLLTNRTRYTRWLVIGVVPLIALIAPPARQPWVGDLMETFGVMCLVICLVGRGWSSIYIAGRKDTELVITGPYSITRNPLYLFSGIGVIGIGLISEVMTVLAVAVIIFFGYYSLVIRKEELYIASLHGQKYKDYRTRVPRWLPAFSKWRDADCIEVQPKRIFNHLVDSSLFFVSFVFFEALEISRAVQLVKPILFLP